LTPDERREAIASRRQPAGRTERRWVQGQFELFEVYRVPTDLLILNATNRRFAAERIFWEQELGRPLDPLASEQDEESIISILLDKDHIAQGATIEGTPSKDTTALITDWAKRGQETALWIRPDGWVCNGNRRLATLRRLARQQGNATGTFGWVEIIILNPAEIDDDDLFQMEAREQLTEGLKLRYTNINLLLTLREAAEREGVDWTDDASIRVVAEKIQDLVQNNARYAEVQLFAIKYMDEFLAWIQRPGRYDLVMGQVERFRDIGKNMVWAKREAPELELDLLEIQFYAVQAKKGHEDMRELRKLASQLPVRFEEAAAEVREVVSAWRARGAPAEVPPEAPAADDPEDRDEDEDDDGSRVEVVPAMPFPVRDVQRALDVAIESRRSHERNDAELAIRTATEMLRLVGRDQLVSMLLGPSQGRVAAAVDEIAAWTAMATALRNGG